MIDLLKETYGFVFEDDLIVEISKVSKFHSFNEGEILIDFGNYIKNMPLLINGAIKILREDFDEGELLLYFIEKGGTCAMTMACCMGQTRDHCQPGSGQTRDRVNIEAARFCFVLFTC